MTEQEKKNETKVKKDKLVGCEVVLDPAQSGMLFDPNNNFTFSFFKNDKGEILNDRREVTSDMDLTCIKRNIKVGILRVMKKGEDVTQNFGGPPRMRKSRPLVSKGLVQMDKADDNTLRLAKILEFNEIQKIKEYVDNISDYDSLVILEDLEKQGNNPSSHSRAGILELIQKRKKKVSGVSLREEEDSQETVEMR